MLSLNVENGITIALMAIVLYLVVSLIFQLVARASGGGSDSGPSFSWSANVNLAA